MVQHEKLIEWYNQECQAVSRVVGKQKKYLFRLIKAYFWFFGIALIIVLLWFALVLAVRDDEGMVTRFILYFLFLNLASMSTVYLIYVFARSKFATLEILEKKQLLTPLDPNRFSKIVEDIVEIAGKMGIERHRLQLYQVISNQEYPSIEEDNVNRVHLALPLNFILAHKKNPEKFKAIMAHELAHIVQKDTEIYQVCNTYYSIMRTLFVPNAVLNIVIMVYMLFKDAMNGGDAGEKPTFYYVMIVLSIAFAIFLIAFFNEGAKNVTAAREKSELLADTASYIYYGAPILEVLHDNKDTISEGYHPSPQKRVDNLNNILSTFKT